MDTEEQLRSTSDQVLGTIDKLQALEVEKRTVPPSSRRFHKLALEVEQLAGMLVQTSVKQSDLGQQLAQEHAAEGTEPPPIEEIEREVTAILAEWRDAERRASIAEAGSADEAAARTDIDRLRDEYQRAHRAASRRREELT
jgi:hypothetical protein